MYAITKGWDQYIIDTQIKQDIEYINKMMESARRFGATKLTKLDVIKIHDSELRLSYFCEGYTKNLAMNRLNELLDNPKKKN